MFKSADSISDEKSILFIIRRYQITKITLVERLICPKKNVNKATIMKFNPPAKSVRRHKCAN